MICLIASFLLFTANYLWGRSQPKPPKKPLLWLGGAALLALAVFCIAIYVIAPSLYLLLLYKGDALAADGNDPCKSAALPYCGEYCRNRSVEPASENCTCIMY